MANENNKGVWKKGDLDVVKIVYKGKVMKNLEELAEAKARDKAKEKEKKNKK